MNANIRPTNRAPIYTRVGTDRACDVLPEGTGWRVYFGWDNGDRTLRLAHSKAPRFFKTSKGKNNAVDRWLSGR